MKKEGDSPAIFNLKTIEIAQLIINIAYIITILIGVIGNLWVSWKVGIVFLFGKKSLVPRNIIILILFICVADLLVLAHLTLVVHYSIYRQWIFGKILCKLSYCIEIVNKLVIPLALVQISRASYESVKMTSHKRSTVVFERKNQTICPKTTYFITICAAIVVIILMAVVINFSTLSWISTRENHQSLMCNFSPPELHGLFFNIFAFSFGYLLTSIAYVYFYLRVPILLKKRYSSIKSSAGTSRLNWMSIMRIRRTVTAFVIVYLTCWTPYWILFWFPSFMRIEKNWMVIIYKFTHLLPYVSCTAYPVILTAINKGIRSAHSNIMNSQRKKFNTIREGAYQMITAQIGFVQTWLREDGARPSIVRPRWSSIGVSRDNSIEQTVVI
ncbi:unnamed protein product [Caenorhabditis angaria]|uniref:G-protein coupled receptors family 1 profile domain-containing protein n=1 Tax=Caenorhabditis angaria TaxID=860376 RepID=A0A9P1IHR4_9PELO|nr:unnamed protein product [Caenorhabditis angaria]